MRQVTPPRVSDFQAKATTKEMNHGDVEPLSGRVLVVVAHQDDETACATLLQRARQAQVVFATDGAPASEFFWKRFGSRQQYASVRRAEALRSLAVIGLREPVFLADPVTHVPFQDQSLYLCLPAALDALEGVVQIFSPDLLLAPAYEGGHPDHDTCSFLVHVVAQKLSIPAWELPLYHRSPTGTLIFQEFCDTLGSEIIVKPTEAELERRDEMLREYVSQPDASTFVSASMERFRPQPDYDFSQPPQPGPLNYEIWRWPMSGAELCSAFESCGRIASTSDVQKTSGSMGRSLAQEGGKG